MQSLPAKKRILIVEDEREVGRIVSLILEAQGYSTTLATDAKQALENIASSPPDLIISDVMMPELNGLQLVAQLKEEEATAAIPVMMMSALTSDSDVLRGEEAGAIYYLKKPFVPGQLTAAVKGVFATAQKKQNLNKSRG